MKPPGSDKLKKEVYDEDGDEMPFKSDQQRKFMWAKHPEIAKKWSEEEQTSNGAEERRRQLRRMELDKRARKRT